MKAKNDEHRSSYQSLPSRNEKPKDKRPSSPDSRDADTEASTSDNEENTASNQPFKELQGYSDKPPMSNKRRICLVGSLLLCVFTVFAFAFILPCHHKTCLKETKWPKWSKNFSGIAPIVLRDVPSTASSNRRILVGFSHSGRGFHILNHTCPGCHGGVVALDGGDGEQLWASGVLGQFGNILCDLNVEEDQQSCIALEDKDKILRIDSNNGSQHWTVKKTGIIKAFKAIRDIDGDGVGEIVLLYVPRPGFTSQLCILSGKTGKHIGRSLTVTKSTTSELHHDVFLRLHQVSDSKQLLLVGVKLASQETGTLLVIRIEDLVTRIHNKTTRGLRWGPNAPNQYGFIELYKDTLVLTPPLFADLNNDGVKDIVLCSLEAGLIVKAINGKDTSHLWSRKLTSTGIRSALPTIVPFGDKVTDIAIMIELDNKSTRIVVLNGKNGLALWMFTLNSPLTVPPVGVPHRLHTPRGLILWLPKVNVRKYMRKRESVKVPSYDMDYKWRKDGPRRKRGTKYLNKDEKDVLLDDLLDELKREQEESENSNTSDHDENLRSSRVHFGKERSAYSKDHGSGDSDVKNDAVINIDDGDDHSQSDSKHQRDNGDYTNGSDDIHEDDSDGMNDSDDDDDDNVINDSVNAGNGRKTDEIELREYLINLEDRLKRQTDSRKIKPTTAIPWTTTAIPATSQQLTQTTQALKENMAKESKPQQDKPLNCDLPLVTVNKDISAVLVYRDPKQQLQLIEMAREKVINIAPEDFVNKFGEQPPVAYSCVQLIPTITTRPIVTDIDGDHRLDLIYAVDYVTHKPSTGPARITHLMKLKKVDISDAIANKHNRKLSNKLYRSDRNNYKRNEIFDSPFLTWNT